nr:MAG TPA: hypothetical protein [Inoviridae sp.]
MDKFSSYSKAIPPLYQTVRRNHSFALKIYPY